MSVYIWVVIICEYAYGGVCVTYVDKLIYIWSVSICKYTYRDSSAIRCCKTGLTSSVIAR